MILSDRTDFDTLTGTPSKNGGAPRTAPLSPYQESFWYTQRVSPDSSADNIVVALRLRGSLSVRALEYGVDRLVQRHDALRTTIQLVGDRPVQIIRPTSHPSLRVEDLRTVPLHERERSARNLMENVAKQPFDLEAGPLMRTLLLQVDDAEYMFVLVLHHIISDAWSLANCSRDIVGFYTEYVTGVMPWMRPVVTQNSDYVQQLQEVMRSDSLSQDRTYWRERLAALPVLELPTDHVRPARQTFNGSLHYADLDPDLWRNLRRLSRQEDASMFGCMMAAFAILMQRYTGQEDFGIASPIALRDDRSLGATVGLLLNTVVIRTALSGDPTFRQFLRQTHGAIDEARNHKSAPYAQVVADLDPKRESGHAPLAQVMLSMINPPTTKINLPGVDISFTHTDRQGAQFDLTCSIVDMADIRGRIALEYNTALFESDTAAAMLRHFINLLASIAAEPDAPISQLEMLDDVERHRLLVEWNQTNADFDLTATFPQIFTDQAAVTPDAVAIADRNRQLTYAELDQLTNRLARCLAAMNVGPGKQVAVAMRRSVDLIVAFLGVLKSGAAYVPLDPVYPKSRLEYMLADSGAEVMLTEREVFAAMHPLAGDPRTVFADDGWSACSGFGEGEPGVYAEPENIAYIMYTSGSTGEPKGVAVPHRALANFLRSMAVEPGICGDDHLLAVTSPSFDISLLELALPLTAGATGIMADELTVLDPQRLADAIELHDVTIMQATPATWRMLVNSGWTGDSSLKVLCGGEALARDLAQTMLARCGSLWNMYGPTETTIWSAVHQVTQGDDVIPIGRPIANTQFYVLDATDRPAAIGVPGELCIGGAGLAAGYLNKPARTAKAFVDIGLDGKGERRIYRTGDLVRYLPNGTLTYLGRLDQQVKVRGHRIELGEVEVALRQHASVADAAAATRSDATGMQTLVAYVVAAQGQVIEAPKLRAYAAEILPHHMVPSVISPVQSIPRLPNGKVDRSTLVASSEPATPLPSPASRQPDTLEQKLITLWQDLLQTGPIGTSDDFFDLGGHSLLAAELMANVRRNLGVQPSLAAFVQNPTIGGLADNIRQATSNAVWSPLVSIQPSGSKPPIFLVHGLGGAVSGYVPLARQLGNDQPVYAFQARGSDDGMEPDSTIEAMARRYVDALAELQPDGGFCLGGYSYGATVAYEMACQLKERGLACDLVVLIEQSAPQSDYYTPRLDEVWLRGFISNLPVWAQDFRDLEPDRRRGRIRKAMRTMWRSSTGRRIAQPSDRLVFLDNEALIPEEHRAIVGLELEAIANYAPRSYDGNVALLRTQRHPLFSSYERSLGWNSLVAGGVDIRYVSGAHHGLMVEPAVQQVASQMSLCLDAVQPA